MRGESLPSSTNLALPWPLWYFGAWRMKTQLSFPHQLATAHHNSVPYSAAAFFREQRLAMGLMSADEPTSDSPAKIKVEQPVQVILSCRYLTDMADQKAIYDYFHNYFV